MRRQPLLHGLEQGRLDDRRDGDRDPVLRGRRLLGGGPPRVLGGAAARPQPGTGRHAMDLVEVGLPHVGGIPQHIQDRGPIPRRLARPGDDPASFNRLQICDNEHPSIPHHVNISLTIWASANDHDVAGLAAPLLFGDIAVPIRGMARRTDPTRPRGEEPAAPAPLADLGPLVFGDDPLDLQEQPPLGAPVEIAVEEDDLDPVVAQLVDQDHLIRVIACQAIGVLDVEAVDGPGGGRVAQPLQGRAEQGLSRVAIVDEAEFGGTVRPSGGSADPGGRVDWRWCRPRPAGHRRPGHTGQSRELAVLVMSGLPRRPIGSSDR